MTRLSLPILGTTLPLLIVTGLYFMFVDLSRPSSQTETSTAVVAEEVDKPFLQHTVFGQSETGRDIAGYVIGYGQESILLLGSIHGNEMGTAALLDRFVEELKADPGLVAADKRLIVIPIANPDGYIDRIDKLNANAVNLNRNFLTDGWVRQEGDVETYAGEEPFSERESRVIRSIVNQYRPTTMVAFHSQGALVSPEYNQSSVDLAQRYAKTSGYEYFDEWDYAGTATRWFVETTNGAAITIELTNHQESDWEVNRAALLELISEE